MGFGLMASKVAIELNPGKLGKGTPPAPTGVTVTAACAETDRRNGAISPARK